jgi:hypothetical protein
MTASMSETLDLWYVKLPNGDVHRVTLDQLDGAFQGGRIDGRTMVMPANADAGTSWTSLSQLLGLDDEPAAAAPAAVIAAPVAAPTPVAMMAPVRVTAAAPSVAPRAYASVAPMSATPPPVAYGQVQAPAGNSLRPMSFDLGTSDLDDAPFQRSSRKGWVVAILGLAAAAGVAGFVSTQRRAGGDDIATVAAAAALAAPQSFAAAPLPAAAPPPQYVPYTTPTAAPAPQTAAPAEASPMNPVFTDRFNQTTKQKLIAADQAREDKSKARHAAAATYHPSSHSKSSGVFTTGGNKYDPLNSNL